MSERLRRLHAKLAKSRAARASFVSSNIEIAVPLQIKALRDARGWTQEDLATAMGMQQPVVSVLERPGAGVSVKKLKAVATAFDVALVVRFVPFSDLGKWTAGLDFVARGLSAESLAPQAFEQDRGFDELRTAAATTTLPPPAPIKSMALSAKSAPGTQIAIPGRPLGSLRQYQVADTHTRMVANGT